MLNASSGPREDAEALDRRMRTLRKKIAETDAIFQKKKAGETLEQNQLTKLGSRKEREAELAGLEKQRRDVLVAGGAELCRAFGVCSNCGVAGHEANQCPRPKNPAAAKASAPPRSGQGQGRGRGGAGAGGERVPGRSPATEASTNAHAQATSNRVLGGSRRHSSTSSSEGAKSHAALLQRVEQKDKGNIGGHREVAMEEHDNSGLPRVLCVAEKPSVAKAIAAALSAGKQRISSNAEGLAPMCRLHEFHCYFPPAQSLCAITVTSVIGHCHSLDFADSNLGDPVNLYGAATRKVAEESTVEHGVEAHLLAAARGCTYLFLWLDCDREGENICFEVSGICRAAGLFSDDSRIFRAHFSALTAAHIKAAWQRPGRADEKQAQAVDARQEIDLKVGASFTRLLTHQLLAVAKVRFAKSAPKLRLLSYGPCQMPTLYFCVQRHREISAFVPRDFFFLTAAGFGRVDGVRTRLSLQWARGQVWQEDAATAALHACRRAGGTGGGWRASVEGVSCSRKTMAGPQGMNTVALLTAAANSLGFSPAKTMAVAEALYTSGIISYPRTESTAYPESGPELADTLSHHASHPLWGRHASALIAAFSARHLDLPPRAGLDKGDHPPIAPTRSVTQHALHRADEWRLYELVARTWLASLSPPLRYWENTASLSLGSETFTYTWHSLCEEAEGAGAESGLHFAAVMPWRLKELALHAPPFRQGDAVEVQDVRVERGRTKPPTPLKEAELVACMDRHAIGTDASIPTHISNIIDRFYVRVTDTEGNPWSEEQGGGRGRGEGAGGEGTRGGRGGRRGARGGSSGQVERGEGGGRGVEVGGGAAAGKGRCLQPTELGLNVILVCYQPFARSDTGYVDLTPIMIAWHSREYTSVAT